jgi:hypothetical protein
MHLVLPNVLILFIVIFEGLHLFFLILITNTLLLSLMTLVVLLGFTSSRLRLKFFLVPKRFLTLLETQFSTNIKVLRSDSGGEYMSNEFQDFLQSKGIIS